MISLEFLFRQSLTSAQDQRRPSQFSYFFVENENEVMLTTRTFIVIVMGPVIGAMPCFLNNLSNSQDFHVRPQILPSEQQACKA